MVEGGADAATAPAPAVGEGAESTRVMMTAQAAPIMAAPAIHAARGRSRTTMTLGSGGGIVAAIGASEGIEGLKVAVGIAVSAASRGMLDVRTNGGGVTAGSRDAGIDDDEGDAVAAGGRVVRRDAGGGGSVSGVTDRVRLEALEIDARHSPATSSSRRSPATRRVKGREGRSTRSRSAVLRPALELGTSTTTMSSSLSSRASSRVIRLGNGSKFPTSRAEV